MTTVDLSPPVKLDGQTYRPPCTQDPSWWHPKDKSHLLQAMDAANTCRTQCLMREECLQIRAEMPYADQVNGDGVWGGYWFVPAGSFDSLRRHKDLVRPARPEKLQQAS